MKDRSPVNGSGVSGAESWCGSLSSLAWVCASRVDSLRAKSTTGSGKTRSPAKARLVNSITSSGVWIWLNPSPRSFSAVRSSEPCFASKSCCLVPKFTPSFRSKSSSDCKPLSLLGSFTRRSTVSKSSSSVMGTRTCFSRRCHSRVTRSSCASTSGPAPSATASPRLSPSSAKSALLKFSSFCLSSAFRAFFSSRMRALRSCASRSAWERASATRVAAAAFSSCCNFSWMGFKSWMRP